MVDVPPCIIGLVTVTRSTPSGTFVRVVAHDHPDGSTPTISLSGAPVIVRHFTAFLFSVGAEPWPDDARSKLIELVTESQSIGMLNWISISTVVAFVSPDSAWMRASCPGRKRVIIGRGATHSF